MFKMIENKRSHVEEQKHFQERGHKVVVVPIRFILVQINQYFKIKIGGFYLKISHQILKKLKIC
jgi:hypothetical protein